MWIRIANKFAKFRAKRLNRTENISKRFRGGGYFLNILYSHKIAFEPTCVYVIVLKFASVTILKARTSALDKWQITTIQDEVWLFIF